MPRAPPGSAPWPDPPPLGDGFDRPHVPPREPWSLRGSHHASDAGGARLLSPDRYLEKVEPVPGSWWPTWAKWLEEHSSERKVAPPPMGAPKQGLKPLGAAPGQYVLAR